MESGRHKEDVNRGYENGSDYEGGPYGWVELGWANSSSRIADDRRTSET